MTLNTTEPGLRHRRLESVFIAVLWVIPVLLAGLNWRLGGPLPPLFMLAGGLVVAALPTFYWRWRRESGAVPVVSSMALAAQIALLTITSLPLRPEGLQLYQDMHFWFFAGLCLCACWLDRRAVLGFFGVAVLYQLAAYWLLANFWFAAEIDVARQLVRLGMFGATAAALFVLTSRWRTARYLHRNV
ncbi:hypothetical protein FF80_03165 [Devosia sp. LC5]|uniref:hypothetical protein n=1 Tax=Devosia sp. LC5 TaxID=1502724 RepID=UPI0004E457C8|nr:hypothetical protein [Devosia sp. LC5]KFC64542.1 hypothetical protein FF80_03165 [Devosia sp. LC5]